jgi:preprotein translocase subunit Sss1
MEEYAIASLKANRSLLRKRAFLAGQNGIGSQKVSFKTNRGLSRKERILLENKLRKIEKRGLIQTIKVYAIVFATLGFMGYILLEKFFL